MAVEWGGSLNSHGESLAGVLYIAPFGACQPGAGRMNSAGHGQVTIHAAATVDVQRGTVGGDLVDARQ